MQMGRGEIVMSYKQAANRQRQIRILAELNSCSEGEIIGIIRAAGFEELKAVKKDK